MTNEHVSVDLPRESAERLAEYWRLGYDDKMIVEAVRDLFGGQDGHLDQLEGALLS